MQVDHPAKPNVILILVDDMGFADLGVMGSEIKTPNLEQMAHDGVLLTQMYNCARCCPTRASLLTGLYPHNAGVGHMGAHLGTAAYQGHLRDDAVTIAEVLQLNGYRTLMSGKWHVAGENYLAKPERWPSDQRRPTPNGRGFDRFYGILDGVTHFFSPHYNLMENELYSAFGECLLYYELLVLTLPLLAAVTFGFFKLFEKFYKQCIKKVD